MSWEECECKLRNRVSQTKIKWFWGHCPLATTFVAHSSQNDANHACVPSLEVFMPWAIREREGEIKRNRCGGPIDAVKACKWAKACGFCDTFHPVFLFFGGGRVKKKPRLTVLFASHLFAPSLCSLYHTDSLTAHRPFAKEIDSINIIHLSFHHLHKASTFVDVTVSA